MPATALEITEHIHQLFASLPIKGGEDRDLVVKGYLIALQGYPEWAIGNAVRKFIRGIVPKASTTFCPRAPELSKAVRDEVQHVYDELERKKRDDERKTYQPVNPRRTKEPERPDPPRGEVLATFETADEGLKLQKKAWPVGTTFVYREGKVYGPPAGAAPVPPAPATPEEGAML